MPFQPMNFANIAPQGNPFMRDLVDNLAKGYMAGQLPSQMGRQRQKEEIANSMSQLLLEEQPELFKSQMSSASLSNALKNLQIQSAERENDPAKKIAYIQALTSGLGDMGGSDSSGLARALIRSQLGLPQQTPEEQLQQQLKLYQMKQQFSKGVDNPTTATVTSNQGVIQAVNNTLPLIDELKNFNAPGQFLGKYFSPNDQAKYESQVATITDSLVNALKLPKTNESIALVQKIVGKRAWENDSEYKKRLAPLTKDLVQRRTRARDALKGIGLGSDSSVQSNRTFNLETGEFE